MKTQRICSRLLAAACLFTAVTIGTTDRAVSQAPGRGAEAVPTDHGQSFRVEDVHRGGPFEYTMRPISENAQYRVYRLEYPSPIESPHAKNNMVPADYYVPRGLGEESTPRPAVVCLHILNGNFELVQMTCSLLASRGIPAVWLRMPYYGERSLPEGRRALLKDPSLFVGAMPQGVADVRRTIDVLASRPEVDAERVGVTGISLGGILAGTVAAVDERVHRTVLILAGGDLPQIIDTADETRELRDLMRELPEPQRERLAEQLREVDPLTHAAGLRKRAQQGLVLMINAGDDHVVARGATEKLAAALGIAERVVWLEGLGHYTAMAALPQVMKRTADFFAADLPADADEPVVADASSAATEKNGSEEKSTPLGRVVELVGQVAKLVGLVPKEGRCHYVDVAAEVTLLDGSQHVGWVRFIRGHGHRFRLEAELPEVGRLAMGQGEYPWMAAGDKVVFEGTEDPMDESNPLAFAAPEHLLKVKMASSALGAVALAPMALEQWIRVSQEAADDTSVTLQIAEAGGKKPAVATLMVDAADSTPRRAEFKVPRADVAVDVRVWQIDTVGPAELFEQPAGPPTKAVSQRQITRMFSAMFNFAMEHIR